MVVIKRTDTLYQFWNALCYFATICSFVTKTVWSRAACRTHSAWFVSSFFFFFFKNSSCPPTPLNAPTLALCYIVAPFLPRLWALELSITRATPPARASICFIDYLQLPPISILYHYFFKQGHKLTRTEGKMPLNVSKMMFKMREERWNLIV